MITREQVEKMHAGRELDAALAEHCLRLREVTLWKDGVCRARGENNCWVDLPHYSTDIAGAWPIFIAGLVGSGWATITGDMEHYARGAITRGKAEEVVTVVIGGETVTAPVCEAICKAFMLSMLAACGA